MSEPIVRLWPGPAGELDDAALADAYLPGPGLRVNFVSSLDGAAEIDGVSAPLSSPADKRVFGVLRMQCDALLVGAGTMRQEGYRAVRLDERRRAWREERGWAPYPVLVVVSRGLKLDPAAMAFVDAPVRPIVLTCAAAPADRRAALAEVAEVLVCGDAEVDLTAGVAALHERGHQRLLSEGGPQLFGSLIAADLVDELCLTVSPLLAGGSSSRIAVGPPSATRSLSLRQVLAADSMLLLRYNRQPPV